MKKKILLIDDDKDFGLLLRLFFNGKNYELLLAYNLSDGMAAMEKERPDYLFLDNGLPDGQGWGKEAYIQAHYPETNVNLISAVVPDNMISNNRILEKPIKMNDLMACLAL